VTDAATADAATAGVEPATIRAGVAIEALDAEAYEAAIPGLATLVVDAVEGGAGVNFLAGVSPSEAGAWWEERTGLVREGVVTPFVARDAGRIVGSAILVRSRNPNSPHRAEIGKVIVLRAYRRRGIAAALMLAAEARALADGRWLLILDTVAGSPAAAMYERLGWRAAGTIPDFALAPDGTPEAATVYWKDLRR
jgi:GNAT superfamily N-acetyltransferase